MYVIKIGEPLKEGANRGVFLCNGKIVHFACNKWSSYSVARMKLASNETLCLTMKNTTSLYDCGLTYSFKGG